ncbi:MAG: hypothetical protein WJU30_00421 [Candidatus Phytoplasma pruni]
MTNLDDFFLVVEYKSYGKKIFFSYNGCWKEQYFSKKLLE